MWCLPGAQTQNRLAGLPSGLEDQTSGRSCPSRPPREELLQFSGAVLLHGSPCKDLLAMTVQDTKKPLGGPEAGRNFQGSWGLKTSVSLQEGEQCLLSVVVQAFLFEHQPH